MMVFSTTFVTAKQRGASLLEFAVVVTVIGLLITFLLISVQFYQRAAERAAIKLVVVNIRTALEIKVAQGKLPGQVVDFADLAEQNPLRLLKNNPANYAGELFSPRDSDIGEGNWCFDRGAKTLIYLLNSGNSFGDAQTQRLGFKVKLLRLPNSTDPFQGVVFEQVKD
jgi:general secretion pathway protein G